ncbi:hypothetical protein PGT21_036204 [Puccinia graminis f. sp. tritici]|uniref:Uncharacterized protein n=1 Tax=Puccinia graminis f. sp. tritici TaxID=56615 RepID=A0A5B0R4P9_PUCGR|nr:hypothetical protein PGT21_036204 [Puccinia graminis f. sp. tritici]
MPSGFVKLTDKRELGVGRPAIDKTSATLTRMALPRAHNPTQKPLYRAIPLALKPNLSPISGPRAQFFSFSFSLGWIPRCGFAVEVCLIDLGIDVCRVGDRDVRVKKTP